MNKNKVEKTMNGGSEMLILPHCTKGHEVPTPVGRLVRYFWIVAICYEVY